MLTTFKDLMRLSHGFESAKIFLTANDLGIFQELGEGKTAPELAHRIGADERALTLMLNALVALGLLVKGGEIYRNAPVVDEFLSGQGYRGHIFRHIHHCWPAWSDLERVVCDGGPKAPREREILGPQEEWTRDFIRGMDDVTRELAPAVVKQLDLGGAKVLLDVGGGPGTYAAAFLDAHPSLEEVRLFDLPLPLEVAREKLEARDLLGKVTLIQGDFTKDSFDNGVDAVWISQVLHSQDEAGCKSLIEKAWGALNPGGRLFIHEFLLDDGKTSPVTAAIFAVHMLVMTDAGRTYSGKELSEWMRRQGFESLEIVKVSDETGVVSGRKP